MKIIKEGIYQFDRENLSVLDAKEHVSELKNVAENTERLRSRICFHTSTDSIPQHMFICFEANAKVEVSTHINGESFLINSGAGHYRFYSDQGEILHDIRMSPAAYEGTFYAFIKSGVPHRFFALTKNVTAHEVWHSFFSTESTSFPTGGLMDEANKMTSEEISKQPLTKNFKTDFKRDEEISNLYYFDSPQGVCEISYEDILNLKTKNKKNFFLMPSKTMSPNNYEVPLERMCVLMPKEEIEISLNNSILFLISGKIEINVSNKNYLLSNNERISMGPFKETKIKIVNCEDKISIIHLTNERAI